VPEFGAVQPAEVPLGVGDPPVKDLTA